MKIKPSFDENRAPLRPADRLNRMPYALALCIFLSAVLVILTLLSFSSCAEGTGKKPSSPEGSEYVQKILSLQEQIVRMRDEQYLRESSYLENIRLLESRLAQQQQPSPTGSARPIPSGGEASPSASDSSGASPTPSGESFGFLYTLADGEATITAYRGDSLDLLIPAAVDGYPVTAIGDGAFEGTRIRSVSLPDTVKSVGWFAFRNCRSLAKAVCPQSVTSIGYEAFSGCKSLTVYAEASSYSYKYAVSYGIPVSAR